LTPIEDIPMKAVIVNALVALVIAGGAAQAQTAAASADPLFEALGGQPGIARLVDELVPRLAADPRIGPSFKDTNLRELNRQLGDQFCVVAGGPCRYEGGSMKEAHAALRIDKADFNRLVELLQDAMDARAIPFADQNRLLARLAPMHRDVITVY